MNDYQQFIAVSRYARWIPEKGRRETWEETVDRYIRFFQERNQDQANNPAFYKACEDIRKAILNLEVMPSMRALMTAGPALDRDNVAGYNCSYLALDGNKTYYDVAVEGIEIDEPIRIGISKPIDFDEAMYVLLCGTGVGFSVERQYVSGLPTVGKKLSRKVYARTDENYPGVPKEELSTYARGTNTIYVTDSKYGWASALRILIVELYNGNFDIKWDVSKVRPAGAPLKTFGGRASGPQPLVDLFQFTIGVFRNATGRKLQSIECHDIMCKIADVVVVGGVRRSALISLSNLTDDRMRHAKSGQYWNENGQRGLANNSVAYTEKPDMQAYMREWLALVESGNGERGIFNRKAAEALVPDRRKKAEYKDYGCNPCSEIVLRNKQFCNLTEVVVRPTDTFQDLRRKVEQATILGTLQATLTDFKYLSHEWRKNTEEEALLGVSFTGIMDHPVLSGKYSWVADDGTYLSSTTLEDTLEELRDYAIEVNRRWATELGINPAAAITCVKPSGTVSQLVDSASGIHPRYSQYYIRTVRQDKKDPVSQLMIDSGVPYEEDVTNPSTLVFSFPMKAPEGSVMRNDMSAIEQLELWKTYQLHWCEHKPSITVYVKAHEWMEVGSWVYTNFDIVSGVSFLPHSEHTYRQAPYQEIDEDTYNKAMEAFPKELDWSRLSFYEDRDTTVGQQTLACTGGACEL